MLRRTWHRSVRRRMGCPYVPSHHETIVEVLQAILREPIVDVPVHQLQEDIVNVVQFTPQELDFAEQVVDIPERVLQETVKTCRWSSSLCHRPCGAKCGRARPTVSGGHCGRCAVHTSEADRGEVVREATTHGSRARLPL